ncbi:MAG: hypothetical protein ACF8Q5_06125 [Phycisphaerales bacterium JB040]
MSTRASTSRHTQASVRHALCALGACVLALAGCSREAGDPGGAGIESSAERDGASVVVAIPTRELTTVDRLPVTITAVAPPGQAVREISFDPGSAGWTVVEASPARVLTDGRGRSVRLERYLLEPFLDGAYAVPGATATFGEPGRPVALELSTTGLDVEVATVLGEDASIDDLAPPTGPVEPPGPSAGEGITAWAFPVGLGGLIVCAGAVVLALRSGARPDGPDLCAEIDRLRDRPPDEARDRLASLLRGCAGRGAPPSLGALIERLDHERYAPPGRVSHRPIGHEIDEALRVLSARSGGSA